MTRSPFNRATSVYHITFTGADDRRLGLFLKRCAVQVVGSGPTVDGGMIQVRVADDETAISVAKHITQGYPFAIRTGVGVHMRLVAEHQGV